MENLNLNFSFFLLVIFYMVVSVTLRSGGGAMVSLACLQALPFLEKQSSLDEKMRRVKWLG